MRLTYHLVPEAMWATVDRSGPYVAASLANEGFVHCTDGADALIATANRHYREDPRPFVALTLDLDLAGSPWTIEDARRIYPHVHGSIDTVAIVAVQAMQRDEDGTFRAFSPSIHEPGSAG